MNDFQFVEIVEGIGYVLEDIPHLVSSECDYLIG